VRNCLGLVVGLLTLAVLPSACSSSGPAGPSPATTASSNGTDVRVQDVGGNGGACGGDPDCLSVTVTLNSGQVNLLIQCDGTVTNNALTTFDCGGTTAGSLVVSGYTDPSGEAITAPPPFVLTTDKLAVDLWLFHPPNQVLFAQGAPSVIVNTFGTSTGCTAGSRIVDATFSGPLTHLGRVTGTITAVCGS
jgi:hypothetical protein